MNGFCYRYARISAINTQEPVSGMTVLLDKEPNIELASRIKTYSRDTYGTKTEEVQDTAPQEIVTPKIEGKIQSRKKQKVEQLVS